MWVYEVRFANIITSQYAYHLYIFHLFFNIQIMLNMKKILAMTMTLLSNHLKTKAEVGRQILKKSFVLSCSKTTSNMMLFGLLLCYFSSSYHAAVHYMNYYFIWRKSYEYRTFTKKSRHLKQIPPTKVCKQI